MGGAPVTGPGGTGGAGGAGPIQPQQTIITYDSGTTVSIGHPRRLGPSTNPTTTVHMVTGLQAAAGQPVDVSLLSEDNIEALMTEISAANSATPPRAPSFQGELAQAYAQLQSLQTAIQSTLQHAASLHVGTTGQATVTITISGGTPPAGNNPGTPAGVTDVEVSTGRWITMPNGDEMLNGSSISYDEGDNATSLATDLAGAVAYVQTTPPPGGELTISIPLTLRTVSG